MSKISNFKIEGLMVPTFTPMKKDGSLDLERIGPYIDYLVTNNLTQVFINGSTAESYSLSLDERKRTLEKWISESKGRLSAIVVQVGALNLCDSQELARHACNVGAHGIATVPAMAFKPTTVDDLVDYCKDVASAAPTLPFYFYHIPDFTGVNLCMEDFLEKGKEKIPTLVGMKFTCVDLGDFLGCCSVEASNRDDKRFNMLFGADNMLMAAINFGAVGGIGTTYNHCPPLYHRILKNLKLGDMAAARTDQLRSHKLVKVLRKYAQKYGSSLPPSKAVMRVIGHDMGPTRAPLKDMDNCTYEQMKTDLSKIGFFEWSK